MVRCFTEHNLLFFIDRLLRNLSHIRHTRKSSGRDKKDKLR